MGKASRLKRDRIGPRTEKSPSSEAVYRISICRTCDKEKMVASESRMCSRCATKAILRFIDWASNVRWRWV